MIFVLLTYISMFVLVVLYMFGYAPADGTLWNLFFIEPTSLANMLGNIINELVSTLWSNPISSVIGGLAIFSGIATGRDEPIYGGLLIMIMGMLGIWRIPSAMGLDPSSGIYALVYLLIGLYNFIYIYSFIIWLRGKGE